MSEERQTKARWKIPPEEQSDSGTKPLSPDGVVPPPIPSNQLQYADLVQHSGAPPRVAQMPPRKVVSQASTPKQTVLEIETCEVEDLGESRSWLSSIVIHLILFVVVALILSPADFGGSTKHELYVRLGSGESNSDDQGPAVEIAEPEENAEAKSVVDGDQQAKPVSTGGGGGSKSDGDLGPRGKFFGIEATGHDFVYIVDMSGSMRGRRYQRAVDELIRSIEGLHESQRFYVLLFSDRSVHMFRQPEFVPSPIAATASNKIRLASWVRSAFDGGSTDPRQAIQIAMRMNPSAIFMLSDGEFQRPRKNRSMFTDDMDAFTLVQGTLVKPPIHAIAFEDSSSCANMKRLSVLTAGQYRFVGKQNSEEAKQIYELAMDQIRTGQRDVAEITLLEMLHKYGHTEPGWKARQILAEMFINDADDHLEAKRFDLACLSLQALISVDPKGIVTSKMQEALMSKLFRFANDSEQDMPTLVNAIAQIRQTFPTAQISKQVSKEINDREITEAKRLAAKGELIQAIVMLERLQRSVNDHGMRSELQNQSRDLGEQFLQNLEKEKRSLGELEYIRRLREFSSVTNNGILVAKANKQIQKLFKALRDASRAAARRGDMAARSELEDHMRIAMQNHPELQNIQRDAAKRDQAASLQLRRAMRAEKSQGLGNAAKQYQSLIDQYPETLAAEKAREKLKRFNVDSSGSIDDMLRDS